MLSSALDYADRGFPVIPMHWPLAGGCSCRKDCDSIGKHPLINTGKDHENASTDDEQVRAWWKRWPHANIGMPTGQRIGWVVLDIDPRHGGDESLVELEDKHGPLPRTVEARTGSGGGHRCFAHPGTIRISSKASAFAPGLDQRADGGLIVVAPSVHHSGGVYRWVRHPDTCELADLPEWLLDLMLRRGPA